MRTTNSARLAGEHEWIELAELALAQAEAQRVADSFFAVCRYDGRLDETGLRVTAVLQGQVSATIEQPWVFAHGDWRLGLIPIPGSTEISPAKLINMAPSNRIAGSPRVLPPPVSATPPASPLTAQEAELGQRRRSRRCCDGLRAEGRQDSGPVRQDRVEERVVRRLVGGDTTRRGLQLT